MITREQLRVKNAETICSIAEKLQAEDHAPTFQDYYAAFFRSCEEMCRLRVARAQYTNHDVQALGALCVLFAAEIELLSHAQNTLEPKAHGCAECAKDEVMS